MSCYPRLVIAGTYSGVGKSTVTLAIVATLVGGIGSTAEFWQNNWMRRCCLSLTEALRRGTQETLIEKADHVTEMKRVSHLFWKGIKAQPEVEY